MLEKTAEDPEMITEAVLIVTTIMVQHYCYRKMAIMQFHELDIHLWL